MPPRTVKRGAGLAGPKSTTRGTRGAQKAQDPPPEEVAVLVAAPPKRSRNSSDLFDSLPDDFFDTLPDDIFIPILCKLSPSVFANVLLTCKRLNEIVVPISFVQPDFRQSIVNKIMETLKRHLPAAGQEGLPELRELAIRFEERIYTAATSQSDYLREISLKMLPMETKSQNPIGNALP